MENTNKSSFVLKHGLFSSTASQSLVSDSDPRLTGPKLFAASGMETVSASHTFGKAPPSASFQSPMSSYPALVSSAHLSVQPPQQSSPEFNRTLTTRKRSLGRETAASQYLVSDHDPRLTRPKLFAASKMEAVSTSHTFGKAPPSASFQSPMSSYPALVSSAHLSVQPPQQSSPEFSRTLTTRKRSLGRETDHGLKKKQNEGGSPRIKPTPGLFDQALSEVGIRKFPKRSEKLAQSKEVVRTEAPATLARRRSSMTTQSDLLSISTSTTLVCTTIPDHLNNKHVLRRHFSRFGDVVRVTPNLQKHSATVRFANNEAAMKARNKGKSLQGKNIHIYFQKRRPPSTDRLEDKPAMEQINERVGDGNEQKKISLNTVKKQQDSVGMKAIGISQILSSISATSDSEKLSILEKLDKLLRSNTVKESDLAKATVTIGTCPDMCPEKERYLRQHRNLMSCYEMDENRKIIHTLAVKEYSRSSADQEEALPHELRPPPVLRITMDYLLTHIMRDIDQDRLSDWYDFLWNRTRAIRKEISIQQTNDHISVQIMEECARFHICCAHELCEADLLNFDPKINNENLEKTMKTVLDMYDENMEGVSINEAEFRAYHILLNINKSADVLRELQNMSQNIRCSSDVKIAVAAFSSIHSNNFSRFFNVINHASYLQAALLHRYFHQVRRTAILILARAYATAKGTALIPIDDVTRVLHFNDYMELNDFCANYLITLKDGYLQLLRNELYEPDGAVSNFCSNEIKMKMNGRLLGDIISHNRPPSSDLHQPTSSFDQNGKYIGPYFSLLATQKKGAKDENTISRLSGSQSQTDDEIRKKLINAGIQNNDIKVEAKEIFVDVINEQVLDVSKEIIQEAKLTIASEQALLYILDDFIEMNVKKIASTHLVEEKLLREQEREKAESRAKQAVLEAKRRQQEELRRKEKEESIKRATLCVTDDVINEFVDENVFTICSNVHREEKLDHLSDVISNDFMSEYVDEITQELSSEVIKSETRKKHVILFKEVRMRCSVIRFRRWMKALAKLRRHRHECVTYPPTPVSRDIKEQIKHMLNEDLGNNVIDGKSFPIDKRHNSRLSVETPMKLLHDRHMTEEKIKQQIISNHFAYYQPLPIARIIRDNVPSLPGNDVMLKSWKLSVFFSDSTAEVWLPWLQYKLGLRTKDETAVKKKVVIVEESKARLCKVCVCCKIVVDTTTTTDMLGTSGLILYLSLDDVKNINKVKDKLDEAIRCKPLNPSIPLLVVVCECCGDEGVDAKLQFIESSPSISAYKVITMDYGDYTRNTMKLTTGIEWLSSQTPSYPPMTSSVMRDVIEENMSIHYVTPLHRHIALCNQQGVTTPNGDIIVEMYNSALWEIYNVLTDPSLSDLSWPIVELRHVVGHMMPSANWNTASRYNEIGLLFNKLLLPPFPRLHYSETLSEVRDKVLKYCHLAVANHTPLSMSIDSLIFSFVRDHQVEDAEELITTFPWYRIVDAIASMKLQYLYHSAAGRMVVAYFNSSMTLMKMPQELLDVINQVEFNNLEEEEPMQHIKSLQSWNSEVEDSHLHTSLHVSKDFSAKENDWLEDHDVTQVTINEASDLRSEINQEVMEGRRFEKYLESLLEEGATDLCHLHPSC